MACRFCDQPDDQALIDTMEAYIRRMDEAIKVNETVYEHRLNQCFSCESYRNGLCTHCGCFVKVRAMKRHMSCPSPLGNRWS